MDKLDQKVTESLSRYIENQKEYVKPVMHQGSKGDEREKLDWRRSSKGVLEKQRGNNRYCSNLAERERERERESRIRTQRSFPRARMKLISVFFLLFLFCIMMFIFCCSFASLSSVARLCDGFLLLPR